MPRESTALRISDEELARRSQRGCDASFEELVRRFQVPLLQFLRRRSGEGEAEDLLQETFLRAYQNLHRYRPAWRFSTWLFTIARRAGLNRLRRRRPVANGQALDSVPSPSPQPWQRVAQHEDRRMLWDLASAALTEKQLTATWLYYVEDMPIKEIARVLGRSGVAVRTMLFRARKKLLPHLAELGPETPDHAAPEHPARQSTLELTNG